MRSPLAYTPRGGPIGEARPSAAAAFLLAPAVVALVHPNPVVIGAAGAAVLVAGIGARAGGALRSALKFGAILALLIVAVNVLVSRRGSTILVRGWDVPGFGEILITLEALAAGGVLGLRIFVVTAAAAVYSASVDPDRILRGLLPLARHSALTAGVTARLVPLAAADRERLADASSMRGPVAAPMGRAHMIGRLASGSLERSVDVASTLELRGAGSASRPRWARTPRGPHDGLLLTTAAIMLAAAAVGGIGGFEAYPRVSLEAGPAMVAGSAALPALAALPFMAHALRRRRAAARLPVVEVARA